MTAPLSSNNQRVKLLRRLVHDRRARHDEQKFVVDGPRALRTFHESGGALEAVFVDDLGRDDVAWLRDADVELFTVERHVLDQIGDARGPQGVMGVAAMAPTTLDTVLGRDIVVVLDGIQDPGNVGAIVRVAAARGAAVVVPIGNADLYSPRAVRSSAGTLPLVDAVAGVEIDHVIEQMAEAGRSIAGTEMQGGAPPGAIDTSRPVVVVLGGEGTGLSEFVTTRLDQRISVPMAPHVESLNVAVTAGIVLYGLTPVGGVTDTSH